jgi:hypothetical protein
MSTKRAQKTPRQLDAEIAEAISAGRDSATKHGSARDLYEIAEELRGKTTRYADLALWGEDDIREAFGKSPYAP